MHNKVLNGVKKNSGFIVHTEQGWYFQYSTYQRMLKNKGVLLSMSRKGNCLDNEVIENFFGLLNFELQYLQNLHPSKILNLNTKAILVIITISELNLNYKD